MSRDLVYWATRVKWPSVAKLEEARPCHLKLITLLLLISRARSGQHVTVIFPVASKIIARSWPSALNLPGTYRKNIAIYFSIRKHLADCSLQSLLNPRRNASRPLSATAWTAVRWAVSLPSARL